MAIRDFRDDVVIRLDSTDPSQTYAGDTRSELLADLREYQNRKRKSPSRQVTWNQTMRLEWDMRGDEQYRQDLDTYVAQWVADTQAEYTRDRVHAELLTRVGEARCNWAHLVDENGGL